jgi:hypothetical protein
MTPEPHYGTGPWRRRGELAGTTTGVILILLGVAFLLERMGLIAMPGNWWSVFIYLAAVASFANAWRAYRAGGAFGPVAGGSFVWGLVLTVVASIFLFELPWAQWWPAILIGVGVGMVVSSMLGNATRGPGTGE